MSLMSLQEMRIGFFGVGVMGEALLAGTISAGVAPSHITFCEKRDERALEISERYGATRADVADVAGNCDLLMLVVKPQDLGTLLSEISTQVKKTTLVVSFAAGKTTSFISAGLANKPAVVRVMPNTPLLIGKGMSAISAGPGVSESDLVLVSELLSASGKVVTVDESLQDAVTAVSGSGPAYFFAFVEAMVAAGTQLGLSQQDATTLTIQTIVGAAAMLVESGKSATILRENVTSPNGTTAAALKKFSEGGLADLVASAMTAARDRSQELA